MKKKKRILRIVIPLAALALLAGGLYAFIAAKQPFHTGSLAGEAASSAVIGRGLPEFSVGGNGDFTILQLTDTHFIAPSNRKDRDSLAAVAAQLDAQPVDLVVCTGDIWDGYNSFLVVNRRASVEALAQMMEDRGQYWAFVPGNNDGEDPALGSTADLAAVLAGYPHCLVANEEGLTGNTQYVLRLHNAAGELVHALVFMDSLLRDPTTDYKTYDHFKDDQAQWLRGVLEGLKAENANLRASLFFHMNPPSFSQALLHGEPYSEDYGALDFPGDWGIAGSANVDAAMQAVGNVGLVSIGHLHPPVNWCNYWNGTYYQIVRASSYHGSDKPGAALITIHSGAENTRDMYDFAEIIF